MRRLTSQSANCLNKKCTLQSVAFLELMPQPQHLWNGSLGFFWSEGSKHQTVFSTVDICWQCYKLFLSTGPDSQTASALWQGLACFARTNSLKISIWRNIQILMVASRIMIDSRATPSPKPCFQCLSTISGYALVKNQDIALKTLAISQVVRGLNGYSKK